MAGFAVRLRQVASSPIGSTCRQVCAAAGSLTSSSSQSQPNTTARLEPADVASTGTERSAVQPQVDYTLQVFRAHNSSLPYLQHQLIQCRVIAVYRRWVLVYTGYKAAQRLFKDELKGADLFSGADGLRLASPDALVVGDVIHCTIQELETPYGDMWLDTGKVGKDAAQQQVWQELKMHWEHNIPVMGRVLNAVTAGYAVGLGGLVAFCPYSNCSLATCQRVGVLQPFLVQKMTEETRNVIVRDASLLPLQQALRLSSLPPQNTSPSGT